MDFSVKTQNLHDLCISGHEFSPYNWGVIYGVGVPMMDYFKKLLFLVLVPTLTLASGRAAHGFTLSFGSASESSNNSPTGASAAVEFSFVDQQSGVVKIILDISNTTGDVLFGEGATTSKLTGVGFDLPTGASYGGAFTSTGYLDTLLLNASFSPFGTLGIGIADNNNFLGGNANDALPEGQATVVSFDINTGLNASGLEDYYFTGFGDGSVQAGARFQQVNAGEGSDKLNGGEVTGDEPVPFELESAAGLLVMGLWGLRRYQQTLATNRSSS